LGFLLIIEFVRSTDKNVKIVRLNVITGVRTSILLFYVCEFMMILSSYLSTKKTMTFYQNQQEKYCRQKENKTTYLYSANYY